MTVVDPMVSTAGSLLTMAWRRAMRVVPMARAPVTTAGRDSGTAATARLMPQMSISSQPWPRNTPSREAPIATTRQMMLRTRPMTCMRFSRGVCSAVTSVSIRAIWPNWVSMPVAVTTARPRP
jgi:hypothetical protein